MARYDLDLRMGLEHKLKEAELDTGTLSYAVDTKNIFIDALLADASLGRQLTNAGLAYGVRDKQERIVAEAGNADYSFNIGRNIINDNECGLVVGQYNVPSKTHSLSLADSSFSIGGGSESDIQLVLDIYNDISVDEQTGEISLVDKKESSLTITYDNRDIVLGYFKYSNKYYKFDENSYIEDETSHYTRGFIYAPALTFHLKEIQVNKPRQESIFSVGNGTDERNRKDLLNINTAGGLTMGKDNIANECSLSIGHDNNTTGGFGTIALGDGNIVANDSSIAIGVKNEVLGMASFASGSQNKIIGNYSSAIGSNNIVEQNYSHAEGRRNKVCGQDGHAEGTDTIAYQNAHAEGSSSIAKGYVSHAEGNQTIANGSYSHAEGYKTKAEGNTSHAENSNTAAYGLYSHAEGSYTSAYGYNSHSQGEDTAAIGDASFSGGCGTIALADNSTSIGSYNITNGSFNETMMVSMTPSPPTDIYVNPYSNTEEITLYYGSTYSLDQNDGLFSLDVEGTVRIKPGLDADAINNQLSGKYVLEGSSGKVKILREFGSYFTDGQGYGDFYSDTSVTSERKDSNNYLLTVGNGENDDNRSNAFLVNSNGDTYIAGDLYVNTKNGNPDEVEKEKVATESEVKKIASSIVTDIWYRGKNPPPNTKLLWIRYDTTSAYGNGVPHYYMPSSFSPSSTTSTVKCSYPATIRYDTSLNFINSSFVTIQNENESITIPDNSCVWFKDIDGNDHIMTYSSSTPIEEQGKKYYSITGYEQTANPADVNNWQPISSFYY